MSTKQANHLRTMCQCLVLACVGFSLWARADEPTGRVIDRAVAIISGQVLTLSELDFEARVIFVRAGGVEAATAELDTEALRTALEVVISNRVASAEAEALQAYPLEEGELTTAMREFKLRFASQKEWLDFLGRHEADEEMVEIAIARLLRAQRVLDGKLRLKAQVTEGDAKRYQASHPELKELPVARVRELVFAQRFKALAAAEMKQARKAAKVRLLGPFAEAALDGGLL